MHNDVGVSSCLDTQVELDTHVNVTSCLNISDLFIEPI